MPSTTELKAAFLESVKPGVSLDDTYFRKLYGWSMDEPDFLEKVFSVAASRQVDIIPGYRAWVQAYEAEQAQISREMGEWYGKWMEQRRERLSENPDKLIQ